MEKNIKHSVISRLWNYFKFQFITKLILSLIFIPIFILLRDFLIKSTGRVGISSGDYVGFLLTWQGILLVIISFVFLVIMVGIDLNAFVIMSSILNQSNDKISIKSVIIESLKSIKKFFSPAGIIIVIYIGLVIPLLGIGFKIGPLAEFEIPNFIMSVVENTPVYHLIYGITIFILSLMVFFCIFTVHFILLMDKSPILAIKNSVGLIKKYWKNFIKFSIILNLKLVGLFILFLFILILIVTLPFTTFHLSVVNQRTLIFFVLIFVSAGFSLMLLLGLPIEIDMVTILFMKYQKMENKEIQDISQKFNIRKIEKRNTKLRIGILIGGSVLFFLIVNFMVSLALSRFFDEIFKREMNVTIVAHRAGGDLGAENSLQGLEAAIKENAKFAEIDVQRTKDGHYIINHDNNFYRLSGDKRSSRDMTLEEIQKLTIKNQFNPEKEPQKIPTLKEMMELSKGKIGLFIELKGNTADKKMVDDVVKLIKEMKMEKETAILSLDYNLIKYTEQNYPEIDTGFLYFFSFGDVRKLEGDFLIMEEREATDENIDAIHSIGKKAIVWTVNTDESINKFISKNVDGIITDHIPKVKEIIEERQNRTDIEIIFDSIFEN